MQRTLVFLKPDALQRGLAGDIISRFERRGLKLVGLKLMAVSEELARTHYAAHAGKDFFEGLVAFITSGPILAMVWEGPEAVAIARATLGATHPAAAAPGTVRGDFGIDVGRNLAHGSDSEEAARREMALFFSEDEIVDYPRDVDRWVTES